MIMNDYVKYPEHPLNTRIRLAFNWIPKESHTLLDGGCAWGYGTRHFKKKCEHVYGVDALKDFIVVANVRYTEITFLASQLEEFPFKSSFFDVIILNDVFEHVSDEIKALNEIYRISKSSAILIMTTPHKGLFSFLDPENYKFYLSKKMPLLYKSISKHNDLPEHLLPLDENRHRHYSLSDFVRLFENSKFDKQYEIIKIFRSGLLFQVFTLNLEFFFDYFVNKKISQILLKPFQWLSRIDFWIPYYIFSYNIALKIKLNKFVKHIE